MKFARVYLPICRCPMKWESSSHWLYRLELLVGRLFAFEDDRYRLRLLGSDGQWLFAGAI